MESSCDQFSSLSVKIYSLAGKITICLASLYIYVAILFLSQTNA